MLSRTCSLPISYCYLFSHRFQIQRGASDPHSYKSLGDCFRTIFRSEGYAVLLAISNTRRHSTLISTGSSWFRHMSCGTPGGVWKPMLVVGNESQAGAMWNTASPLGRAHAQVRAKENLKLAWEWVPLVFRVGLEWIICLMKKKLMWGVKCNR